MLRLPTLLEKVAAQALLLILAREAALVFVWVLILAKEAASAQQALEMGPELMRNRCMNLSRGRMFVGSLFARIAYYLQGIVVEKRGFAFEFRNRVLNGPQTPARKENGCRMRSRSSHLLWACRQIRRQDTRRGVWAWVWCNWYRRISPAWLHNEILSA